MTMIKAVTLTDGLIIPSMLVFSFPIIMGNLFHEAYNPADTLIIGRCPGPYALASVGIGLLFLLYSCYRRTERPEWSIVQTVFSPGTIVLVAYTLSPHYGEKAIWCLQTLSEQQQ